MLHGCKRQEYRQKQRSLRRDSKHQGLCYVLCMYCVCTVYVLCMYCVCTVYVLCMYCVCTVYVLCMYCVCTVYVLCMYCVCTVYVLCMYCVCTVYVLCMYCVCTVYVLCMYCVCTVYVLCMYCVCTVYVLCMYCETAADTHHVVFFTVDLAMYIVECLSPQCPSCKQSKEPQSHHLYTCSGCVYLDKVLFSVTNIIICLFLTFLIPQQTLFVFVPM